MVKKKKKETYSGTGYEDEQYPFVFYNRSVKQRRNCSFLSSSSIATTKLNDPIVGSLVKDGSRIFNDIHNRGEILYGSF